MNNKLTRWVEDNKEEIIAGIVVGIAVGIVAGIAVGIVVGIVVGIAVGIVVGIAVGIGSLIGINLLAYFQNMPNNFWLSLFIVLALTEIIFKWFDKKKPSRRDNNFNFTLKRKAIALLQSLFIFVQVIGSINTYEAISPKFQQYYPEILKWIGYIGFGLIILFIALLVGYFWIKINEQKYKK